MSVNLVQRQEFAAGDMLYHEGDDATAMYMIQAGSIEILKRSTDGFIDVTEMRGPGQVLGELALLTSRPRTEGARAKTASTAIAPAVNCVSRAVTPVGGTTRSAPGSPRRSAHASSPQRRSPRASRRPRSPALRRAPTCIVCGLRQAR